MNSVYALLTDFLCISVEPLPVAGALRPRGSTGDSQLHCHLLPGGAGGEDTDALPQPLHRHPCQTQSCVESARLFSDVNFGVSHL